MNQMPNTPPADTSLSTGSTAPTPAGGQPGAGIPPSGDTAPDADAGLLFTAGQAGEAGAPDAGAQTGEGQDGQNGEAGKQPDAVPEKYELTTKEGFAFDDAVAAAVTPMFKELGLTNAQAQKLADYHMAAMQKFQAAQVEQFHALQAAEMEAAKADPDVGGAKLQESLAIAARAMDTYGGQEFRDALQAHGMANNLVMLKFLVNVGRELGGDRFLAGSKPQKEESLGKLLYPDWN